MPALPIRCALKLPLLALGLGMAACAPAETVTHTDSRPGLDLAHYRTYNFMDAVARNDSAFHGSSAALIDLKRAVARQLEARGLQLAAQPALLVNIGLVSQQQVQTRPADFRTDGAPYYIGQRNYHWQANDIAVGTYAQGTATIDLVDAARKELVWQGVTTGILSTNPVRAAKQLDKGVADAFAQLPAPPR